MKPTPSMRMRGATRRTSIDEAATAPSSDRLVSTRRGATVDDHAGACDVLGAERKAYEKRLRQVKSERKSGAIMKRADQTLDALSLSFGLLLETVAAIHRHGDAGVIVATRVHVLKSKGGGFHFSAFLNTVIC